MEISIMNLNDFFEIEPIFQDEFDDFWSSNSLKEELENESRTYIVAKENNEILGFAGFSTAGDLVEIMNVVVRKNKRRMGIGKELLLNLINLAKKTEFDILTLEVNSTNIPAKSLYEKVGFEVIGIRKKYYNNIDDAIIMNLKLK